MDGCTDRWMGSWCHITLFWIKSVLGWEEVYVANSLCWKKSRLQPCLARECQLVSTRWRQRRLRGFRCWRRSARPQAPPLARFRRRLAVGALFLERRPRSSHPTPSPLWSPQPVRAPELGRPAPPWRQENLLDGGQRPCGSCNPQPGPPSLVPAKSSIGQRPLGSCRLTLMGPSSPLRLRCAGAHVRGRGPPVGSAPGQSRMFSSCGEKRKRDSSSQLRRRGSCRVRNPGPCCPKGMPPWMWRLRRRPCRAGREHWPPQGGDLSLSFPKASAG
ncbi:PREDICTED: uncharacterized protein LOC105853944 [Condylura cristata]|uniref:uncharacterized protein LOC105853944 n=1 Tax=Condylura cristata TaxID=143302 RepID=UPI00064338C6|nr:PREDICTED: uncharacterized protein LOC105853944 [Condylura cristata]